MLPQAIIRPLYRAPIEGCPALLGVIHFLGCWVMQGMYEMLMLRVQHQVVYTSPASALVNRTNDLQPTSHAVKAPGREDSSPAIPHYTRHGHVQGQEAMILSEYPAGIGPKFSAQCMWLPVPPSCDTHGFV